MAPISRDIAILSLRYPISCDTFQGRLTVPQNGAMPPLALSFTEAHLCDTPFCNISRDNCAIPHKNKHEIVSRCYRYIVTSIERYEKYRYWGFKKWGLSNGGLRPHSAICAQSSAIVHFCGPFGPLYLLCLSFFLYYAGSWS